MKLWVDADAAPGDVKELIFRAATRLKVEAVLVANQPMSVPRGNAMVSAVLVEGGANVADAYIAEHAEPGDVAVTADIPLASTLVGKRVFVVDPRGVEYDEDNVGGRLAGRNLMDELRGGGAITGGPRPYSPKDRQNFAATFDRVLTRAMRQGKRAGGGG